MQDLLFRDKDFVFSYRVAGVLIHQGCVLMQKEPHDPGHAIPGGHVALGETHEQALIREFREELHADISVGRLMAVGEVFFPWGSKPCHQLCLYYRASFNTPGQVPEEGVFHGFDELGSERISLDYLWVPIAELVRTQVYPPQIASYLLENRQDVMHFIYNELPEDTVWTR